MLVFPVQVISTEWPTYQELSSVYDAVSTYWDRTAYPNAGLHERLVQMPKKTGRVSLLLASITPDRMIHTDEAMQWALRENMRPVFPWEMQAFAVEYPHALSGIRVVSLGHWVKSKKWFSPRNVPHVYCMGQDVCLDHSPLDRFWLNGTRFLFALS